MGWVMAITDRRATTADLEKDMETRGHGDTAGADLRALPAPKLPIMQSPIVAPMSSSAGDDFRAGFIATMPLWLGAAPFGAIYAVSALAAGLSGAQTLAMSLLVFAGASQFTAVGLFASGVAPFTIIFT